MTFHPRLALAAFASLVLGASDAAAQTHRETWRPPPLDGSSACEVFSGTSSGNDPTVLIELRVCNGDGLTVTGQAQHSSKKSGYSVRDLSGAWSPDRRSLELHETGFAVSKPNAGWRFCMVDRYALTLAGDVLSGTYDSKACRDHSTLNLTRPAKAKHPPVEKQPEAPPPPATADVPAPKPTGGTCSCEAPGFVDDASFGASTKLLAITGLLLVALERRRTGSGG